MDHKRLLSRERTNHAQVNTHQGNGGEVEGRLGHGLQCLQHDSVDVAGAWLEANAVAEPEVHEVHVEK